MKVGILCAYFVEMQGFLKICGGLPASDLTGTWPPAIAMFPYFLTLFLRGEFQEMQFKKSKTVLAAILAAAMICSAVLPTAASAAGTRTKEEAYGDSTYAERFMSLYDDVVTNGQQNGYLSQSSVADGGFLVYRTTR